VPRTDVECAREARLIYSLVHAQADSEHTGVMIALVPRVEDAHRLALPGGEPLEELHVTLFYMGDASAMPLDTRGTLTMVVREIAALFTPLLGKTFGVGIFNPTGEKPCLILNVGGDAIAAFRQEIDWRVGSSSDQHRPWASHLTLRYFGEGESPALPDEDAVAARMGPIVFDRVRIAFAGQAVDIPLVEPAVVTAARSARAIFEAERAGASITASRGVLPATRPTLNIIASRSAPAMAKVDGDVLTFPIVPFVQGVRRAANAPHPELYLTKEFARALDSAIRMPIVFQHPYRTDPDGSGRYVSIHDGPFDQHTGVIVGMVTAAEFVGDRMVAQVAVWRSKFAQGGPEAIAVVQALETGLPVEVSIGHFANVVPHGGFYEGEAYFGVHTDVLYDHCALLPLGTPGACSWDAGCGAGRA